MMEITSHRINNYQIALEVCGKKVILTYNNIKKRHRVKLLLIIVRALMVFVGVSMFVGTVLLGNSAYDLWKSAVSSDELVMTHLLRCIIGFIVTFFCTCGVSVLHDIEECLIDKLE